MLRLLQTILWWVARWALHRRYTVQVVGLEKLQGLRGPTLVLPNHPGYIDPPLVWSHVRLTQAVRPVVTTSMYRNPLLLPLMRLVQALEVPDLSEHSVSARDRTLAMIDAVVAGLERGECFLIYPSGHVVHNGREEVGAARTAAEVLAPAPRPTWCSCARAGCGAACSPMPAPAAPPAWRSARSAAWPGWPPT